MKRALLAAVLGLLVFACGPSGLLGGPDSGLPLPDSGQPIPDGGPQPPDAGQPDSGWSYECTQHCGVEAVLTATLHFNAWQGGSIGAQACTATASDLYVYKWQEIAPDYSACSITTSPSGGHDGGSVDIVCANACSSSSCPLPEFANWDCTWDPN